MSDNFLKLIPTSPAYIPPEKSILEALELIKNLFPSIEKITYFIFATPKFIDQGSNFEKIICPKCNSIIDDKWWQKEMDKAFKDNYRNLFIITPCCNEEISLNDLKYEWPAGFASFIIQIQNPNKDITDSELEKLEIILRSSMRKIWSHY